MLLHRLPHAVIEAGRHEARTGQVRQLEVSEDGQVIAAEMWGSPRRLYHQRVALRPDGAGRLSVNGICTCSSAPHCKHIAAVLIAAGHDLVADIPSLAPPALDAPLPPDIAAWLRGLERSEKDASEIRSDSLRQRLVYVLGVKSWVRGPDTLSVACFSITLRKDGSPGAPRQFAPRQLHTPVRHMRPSDQSIMRRVEKLSLGESDLSADDDPVDLLRRIIATGHAHWGELDGPAVREGPCQPGSVAWQVNAEGSQRAVLALAEGLVGFRLSGPWYANPAVGTLGPVDCGLPGRVVASLLAAPPIPAEAAPRVAAALAQRLPALPAPAALGPPEVLQIPAVPVLLLTRGTVAGAVGHPPLRSAWMGPAADTPLARLSFRYGPITVPHAGSAVGQAATPPLHARDGKLFRLVRDRRGEQAALTRLGGIGFAPARAVVAPAKDDGVRNHFVLEDDQDGTDWLSVVLDEVPALRRDGWAVEFADDFPLRVVEADGAPEAELRESSGIDWLELHLGVTVGGERVDLVPALVQLIAGGDGTMLPEGQDDNAPFLVELADGRLVALPVGQIRPILQALVELFASGGIDPDSGRIGFNRLDAAEIALLEERAGLIWRGGEAVRALGQQLRAAGGAIPPVALPPAFRGALRPYQAQGVAWLQFLRAAGLGGVLADDMGLGKTVQTLAHLAVEQAEGRLDRPALIVCPTSLVPNWTLEAERFSPSLKLLSLHGPARKERFAEIGTHDLVLTTYPLLTRDHDVLTAQDWHVVVLDEAQTIKNPNAETTRQALRLKAGQRICLSGTPLQNHLGELWSLFDFLAPSFLGDAKSFRTRYRTPIEKHGDAARQLGLARRVRPFLLRRTKDEVVQELPPKTEITESIEMEPAQRAIYEGIRLAMHTKVRAAIAERGLARSGIIILDALLKLRQACCDPRLLKLPAAREGKAGSAKLDRLIEMLETMLAEGRRVLVFSQFTSMLALIAPRLQEGRIDYVTLTGDTTDRTTPVRRFQAGEVPVFLISLKAGGLGLNLTAADTVIHYDPWWNPAVEDQATDRAHRIGQQRAVFVHRLITLGTIEEKMETLKERKRALVAAVLEAREGSALGLSEADIEELFAGG